MAGDHETGSGSQGHDDEKNIVAIALEHFLPSIVGSGMLHGYNFLGYVYDDRFLWNLSNQKGNGHHNEEEDYAKSGEGFQNAHLLHEEGG